ncbi:HAMP domain-containing histidine kinase [Oculatella sp. LEGE 06141]|uniref:sensor histidine kinase n=1 Tax=Oculatella sp. LEGE 06141 TaxID=1828648 RepID=UPI00187ED382|nr:HAMP domain-containing sensor histidine kinase [Oculatella sp. LEGE 06141]MBE9180423.1 HAMP domain-containing histidine kinase [Oculatella sp. LEGE 06141]
MFNRSRRNLARWFTLSMGSILVVFSGIIYYLEIEDKLESHDRLLYQKARVMASSIEYELVDQVWQVDLSNVPTLGSNTQPLNGELLYARWYDRGRQLVQFFGAPPPPQLAFPPGFVTIQTEEGTVWTMKPYPWIRQVTLPVQEGDVVIGYLQVATPLTTTQQDLHQFRLLLTLALPIALGLISLAGWWLGGVAMQPIRQAYQQLQRFTADASHELRTPLSAVLSNAQVGLLMLSDDINQQRDRLENIVDSAKSMTLLVNNLLLLARHQGRLAPDTLKTIELNSLLQELADQYEPSAATVQLKLITELPPQIIEVQADPDLLRQAVMNLLSNACKYTPAGGVVQLRLVPHPGWAIVQVEDSGIGIPEADLPFVFERFYRVDTERSRGNGGFGLGLAIVQQITQAHGGQVQVTSRVGKGSVFQLELPLYQT